MSKPYSRPGEKGTDTNQASELFELCKGVYERTKWETPDWYDLDPDGKPVEYLCTTEDKIDENDYVPFYNSDYLLKKLPKTTNNGDRGLTIIVGDTTDAGYTEDSMDDFLWWSYRVEADTPLKALLKLCLALEEAGKL